MNGRSLSATFILHPSSFILAFGAGDEIRTRDPQLGRLMLYQLSYTRPFFEISDLKILRSQISMVQGVGFEPT